MTFGLAGALPRTPPGGFAPWTPTKGKALGTPLSSGVKGATAPSRECALRTTRVQGRALAFL